MATRREPSPDPTDPQGWLKIHRSHARPFYEVKIGKWHHWRCPCGERFCFTSEERDKDPKKYAL